MMQLKIKTITQPQVRQMVSGLVLFHYFNDVFTDHSEIRVTH